MSDKKLLEVYRYWTNEEIKNALSENITAKEREELNRVLELRRYK